MFVAASAYLVASSNNLAQVLPSVWHHILRVSEDGALQTPRRILRRPLTFPAELEELSEKLDFLDPSPSTLDPPQSVPVQRFDIDPVNVVDRIAVAEVDKVVQNPFVFSFGLE